MYGYYEILNNNGWSMGHHVIVDKLTTVQYLSKNQRAGTFFIAHRHSGTDDIGIFNI